MGFTDKFRVQHNEILQIAKEMTEQLRGQPDPAALRKLLSNLAGKLQFHLAMEDQALYPRLQGASDPKVKAMANRFMTEMGGLGGAFAAYNTRWQVSAIRADVASFAEETDAVFAALTQRIVRENRELYPLADAAAA